MPKFILKKEIWAVEISYCNDEKYHYIQYFSKWSDASTYRHRKLIEHLNDFPYWRTDLGMTGDITKLSDDELIGEIRECMIYGAESGSLPSDKFEADLYNVFERLDKNIYKV